ncbi:hypothetical protein [Chitinophaga sp. sic0106]|uniref:hypothetical protein n=1 Tax=Chitinophaga sp. sic0106 TaxID=2854785 RepID=UPI001C48F5B6|nr:hypothetical protein [Chitinophaga sp. sic0106]MBV7532969.1 hypothetical protein [Chitinophaga sp. sic0106]
MKLNQSFSNYGARKVYIDGEVLLQPEFSMNGLSEKTIRFFTHFLLRYYGIPNALTCKSHYDNLITHTMGLHEKTKSKSELVVTIIRNHGLVE